MSSKLNVIAPTKKKKPDPSKQLGGSDDDKFNQVAVNQAVNCLWLAHANDEDRDKLIQSTLISLRGIAPRDEMEGMLAVQMVACHNAAIECYRRAMLENQTFEGRQAALNQANRLTRSYTTLMETLNKNRGKGQQKMTVKYVHVHEGGQAIVGNVDRTTGGGVEREIEDQPHAKQK